MSRLFGSAEDDGNSGVGRNKGLVKRVGLFKRDYRVLFTVAKVYRHLPFGYAI